MATAKRKPVPKSSGRKRKPWVTGEPISAPPVQEGWIRAVGSGDYFQFKETGDSITGEVVDVEIIKKKGRSDILTLLNAEGDNVKLAFSKALADKFEKHEIVKGFQVCITLLGIVNLSGKRTFKDLDVMFKAPGKKRK